MKDYVNVIIPRGGKGLIKTIKEKSSIPLIKHLDGICHVFVDKNANLKKAQEKLTEYQRLEHQLIEFNKNAQKTLGDQTRRLRKGRLGEIQEVISVKAKELGYDLVIDSSQDVLLPRTPTVLYTNGKNDITTVIIDILNEGAAGKYKPAEPAPEKSAAPAPTDQ